jgi:hypothetical protein
MTVPIARLLAFREASATRKEYARGDDWQSKRRPGLATENTEKSESEEDILSEQCPRFVLCVLCVLCG